MKLLIDVGNTRLKWALGRGATVSEPGALIHGGEPASSIAALPISAVDEVWIAQVAGSHHADALATAVRNRFGVHAQFARSAAAWRGLHNAYREPQRLGVDRWLVLMAAWSQAPTACCVIDAGTALTADCVDDAGHHLGGYIAAGLETQQRAVLGATRFATRDTAADYGAGLGRDTEACVRQGAMLACLGAIDRAVALTGSAARCLITGGDAVHLRPHLGAHWIWRPHLVLEGLLAFAEDPPKPE